ncbi:MAG TPA: hypothetical protein VFN44_11930 [Solirubrobacteraceae bacterium]|nr:hypothetical protein [Solirubrobacteraceae bacterium]
MRRGLACALAVVAAAAITATARAEVLDDNPAASSRGPNQVTVFIRGNDGTLLTSELSGGSFTPWRSLGGYLDSGPGASGRDATTSDVLVRGGDSALYHQYFTTAGGWSGIGRLGNYMLSAPGVAVRRGYGYIDIFWRGGDNGIEAQSWVPGQGWTAVNNTQLDPGATTAAPAVVSRNTGYVDVIVRGTDDSVYVNTYNGSGWGGWGQIPGGMKTQFAPAATVRNLNTMDIFVRSPAGEVRWVSWDGAAWSGWKTVPGGVDSGPAVVADTSRRIWLFARRGSDVIYNVYDGGQGPEEGWNGWRSMHPPPAPPAPPPACDLAAGRITGHAKLVRLGKRPRLAGRARRTDGAPLVSAAIIVSPAEGGWTRDAVSGADGRYSMRLPAGPTRRLNLQAWAPGAKSPACARPASARAPASRWRRAAGCGPAGRCASAAG